MVVIQNIIQDQQVDSGRIKDIAQQLLDDFGVGEAELLIRLVSPYEIQTLNNQYRGKNQSTNVLSFPSEIPHEIGKDILGDVVICIEAVREEAMVDNKSFIDHLFHILVHGILHLLGYDHIDLGDAKKMETAEIEFLHKIGVKNPYS